MDIQDLGAIGEVIGAIAVVVSLIYLAIQVRNNTAQMKFSSQQAIAEAQDRAFEPIYSEPSKSIWTQGHVNYEGLTESDAMIFDALMVRQLHNFQNTLEAQKQGFVPDHVVNETYRAFYRGLVQSTGGSQWLKEHSHMFNRELITFLEDV